jgi:hypothetical protein
MHYYQEDVQMLYMTPNALPRRYTWALLFLAHSEFLSHEDFPFFKSGEFHWGFSVRSFEGLGVHVSGVPRGTFRGSGSGRWLAVN